MFSQPLHRHLQARDIAVYAVHPGWIRTDMGGEQAPGDPEASAPGISDRIECRTVPAPGRFVLSIIEEKPCPFDASGILTTLAKPSLVQGLF
ncbi:hypothetical protein ACP26L_18285 [Paenibacillus sp. S-38]|uniref:hypothetical protein n=1 Tax=Paenibacillus sp. S-38 TaxID=3416710 RepID=UPI003CF2CA07